MWSLMRHQTHTIQKDRSCFKLSKRACSSSGAWHLLGPLLRHFSQASLVARFIPGHGPADSLRHCAPWLEMSTFSPSTSHKALDVSQDSKSGANNEDRRSKVAHDAAKLLENSEELFRASLSAKNEEISKMTDVLRSVRAELAREVHLVHKLNAQLASAQEDLEQKDSSLLLANQRIADLEAENAEMKHRLNLIVEGNLKPSNPEEEEKARRVSEATIQALRERAQSAERDASVLGGLVSAMKQVLMTQWEESNGGNSVLLEKARTLERNQSVWEAEASAERERANALERQLQGKDETIEALRAQLLSHK